MSPEERDALHRAWADDPPPPLDDDRAEAMILDALWEAGLVQPEAVAPEPPPAAPRRRWWPAVAAAAALSLGTWAALDEAPTPGVVEIVAPTPTILVLEAAPGLVVDVREAQPVRLLLGGGREVLLEGDAHLVVQASGLLLEDGALRATTSGEVAFTTPGGRLQTVDAVVDLLAAGASFSWRVVTGHAELTRAEVRRRRARPAPPPPPSAPSEGAPVFVAPVVQAPPPPPPAPAPVASPAELYASAEAAMAAGEDARAVALLREIVRRWPDAPKAGVALVDLARLQGRSDPAAAAGLYREYLARHPHGPLAAEARRGLCAAAPSDAACERPRK